jgi:hypothetical protein
MKRIVTLPWLMTMALVLSATMSDSRVRAQSTAETFTATASVKTAGGASITAPVVISITRWTSDAERAQAKTALESGGSVALKKALDAMPEAGTIQVGERKTPLRYARALDTGAGRLVTVVTTQPILYLGAGAPESKPTAGYDLAFATFEVNAAGKGTAGDLAPAAKLKIGANDAIVVEDYGVEAVRLSGIAKK